jgi:hypothetical protein
MDDYYFSRNWGKEIDAVLTCSGQDSGAEASLCVLSVHEYTAHGFHRNQSDSWVFLRKVIFLFMRTVPSVESGECGSDRVLIIRLFPDGTSMCEGAAGADVVAACVSKGKPGPDEVLGNYCERTPKQGGAKVRIPLSWEVQRPPVASEACP